MRKYAIKLLCLIFLLGLSSSLVLSQDCQTKYLSLNYKGTTWDTFYHAVYTPANEIVAAGYLLDYNGVAHLAKYTRNGIPIWSNYYNIGFFTFYNPTFLSRVQFNDFVLTPDGGVVVAGTMLRYYNNRIAEIYSRMALLAKIDKYGNVEWSRSYLPANNYPDLSFSNIYQTTDGDLIVYMSHDKGPSLYANAGSYNRVIRYSASGQLKWATNLYSGLYDVGGSGVFHRRAITQLTDKNIVIGDVVYKSLRGGDEFKMSDGRLHFYSLDYTSGNIKWESSYPYTLPATDTFFVPDLNHVAQLPDGRLSFTTSLYLSTPLQPGLTKKPVSIITSNRGVAQKLVTYHSTSGNECLLTDVTAGNAPGTKNLLFRDGNLSVVTAIDQEGSVIGNKGYTGVFPPNCFATGARGISIFMSNYRSLSYKLLITDAAGISGCADAPANILAETLVPVNENPGAVVTVSDIYTSANYRSYFVDMEYPLKIKSVYTLDKTTDCEQPIECCKDVIDTVNIRRATICEGSTFRLPDNTIVKDSGTYYVVNKTLAGCDSITFTNIKIDKSLSSLSLGNDSCLTGNSTIELKATEGYTAYSWMNGPSISSNKFTVNRAGIYKVRVTNICGTKADSIEIYDRCDFPVFLPDAFTPNRDNLNDYFGVPLQNKNRLISLTVYNRWGQVVFETNSVYKRWDGTFKNQVLKTDIFVYYLVMQGLSGNKITQKGKLMLIR